MPRFAQVGHALAKVFLEHNLGIPHLAANGNEAQPGVWLDEI